MLVQITPDGTQRKDKEHIININFNMTTNSLHLSLSLEALRRWILARLLWHKRHQTRSIFVSCDYRSKRYSDLNSNRSDVRRYISVTSKLKETWKVYLEKRIIYKATEWVNSMCTMPRSLYVHDSVRLVNILLRSIISSMESTTDTMQSAEGLDVAQTKPKKRPAAKQIKGSIPRGWCWYHPLPGGENIYN